MYASFQSACIMFNIHILKQQIYIYVKLSYSYNNVKVYGPYKVFIELYETKFQNYTSVLS